MKILLLVMYLLWLPVTILAGTLRLLGYRRAAARLELATGLWVAGDAVNPEEESWRGT